MNLETELHERISRLTEPERRCIAALSAQSLLPVVFAFGEPATATFFQESIEILWREVDELGTPQSVRIVFHEITSLPESNEDDSNKPSFYAMRTMGVLYSACEVWIADDSDRATRDACQGAIELCSGFDADLLGNPVQFYPSASLGSRVRGALEAEQAACQLRFLEATYDIAQTEKSKVELAKNIAKNFAKGLGQMLPNISRKRGWARE